MSFHAFIVVPPQRFDGKARKVFYVEHDVVLQATLALYGGYLLPYYLHEETGWSLSVDDLKSQTKKVYMKPSLSALHAARCIPPHAHTYSARVTPQAHA